MNVALIAPPYPLEESPSPPLGLCYIAAAFEKAGAFVRIFDFIVRKYTPQKLLAELDAFGPDIVGINAVTMNFQCAAKILQTVKQHMPSTITLMGGPHVSFDVENTLNTFPEIDIVVIGEGEQTVFDLMQHIARPKAWSTVQGIAFRQNTQITITGKRGFIEHLDDIPTPARHLLPMSRYLALGFPVSIITSRGCPNQCIFCQGRRMVGQKVRYRDPKLIVDEIEDILSYGFSRINIADDFFTSNKHRVRQVCDEIIKRGITVGWSAFARVDSVDRDCLIRMRNAGCDTISFGVESGNEAMLKRIKKRITLDQTRSAVTLCRDTGMRVFLSFMVGLPGESPKTLQDTHAFAEELDVEYGYHHLAPFPGTTVRENIKNYDLNILTDDWRRYDANQAIVSTSQLSDTDFDAFVAIYNDICNKERIAIERRYRDKTASDGDIIRFEGFQKLTLIFKLLSEDIIETYGTCATAPSHGGPFGQLFNTVSEITPELEISIIENVMKQLVTSGYLKYFTHADKRTWYWTHNAFVDALPLNPNTVEVA